MVGFLALLSATLLAVVTLLVPRDASTRPAVDADAYRLSRTVTSVQKAALHYVRQQQGANVTGPAAYPSSLSDVAGNWFAQPSYMAPTPRLPGGASLEFVYVPASAGSPSTPERFYLCVTATVVAPAQLESLLRGAAVAAATPVGDISCVDAANGLSPLALSQFPTRYTFIKQLV